MEFFSFKNKIKIINSSTANRVSRRSKWLRLFYRRLSSRFIFVKMLAFLDLYFQKFAA